jgi:hypothetical protein
MTEDIWAGKHAEMTAGPRTRRGCEAAEVAGAGAVMLFLAKWFDNIKSIDANIREEMMDCVDYRCYWGRGPRRLLSRLARRIACRGLRSPENRGVAL